MLCLLVLVLLVVLVLAAGPAHLISNARDGVDRVKQLAEDRTVLVALLVTIGGVVSLWYTRQRLRDSANRAERFGNAVDRLGNESLDVRLAGVFALERLSNDSAAEYRGAVDVLCRFARDRSVPSTVPAPLDVRTAGAILARRRDLRDPFGLDLRGANFSEAKDLNKARFGGANLIRATLAFADLEKANLVNADLAEADLTGANLAGANLTGANLSGAVLTKANLCEAVLRWTELDEANLTEADLLAADLFGARLYRATLTGVLNWPVEDWQIVMGLSTVRGVPAFPT
ncbi:MAG TPA: pentapeptide repeat-containing protein [Nocardioidaceae bacterium]|nr:pentapeptide repeat-containing protein [Nocardioidaceae bacterium]